MTSDSAEQSLWDFLAAGGDEKDFVATFVGPDGSEIRLRPFWDLYVHASGEFGLPPQFDFEARTRRGEVLHVTVVVHDGRARVSELTVAEADGKGIRGLVLDGLALQSLVTFATQAVMARGAELPRITSDERQKRASEAAVKATRKRVTEPRLEQVADAYKRSGIQGVVDLGMTDRHAYRLKRRAVEAGLLPPKERP